MNVILLDKVEKVVHCDMSALQRLMYNQMFRSSMIIRGSEKGTVSSTLVALGKKPRDAIYQFAGGAPDQAKFSLRAHSEERPQGSDEPLIGPDGPLRLWNSTHSRARRREFTRQKITF